MTDAIKDFFGGAPNCQVTADNIIKYLRDQNLEAGELLWSNSADALGIFHSKCDGKGLSITLAVSDKGGFAGIAGHYAMGINAYGVDNSAVIFTPDGPGAAGTFFPAKDNANAVYRHNNYGPTWGNASGHNLAFSVNALGGTALTGSCTIGGSAGYGNTVGHGALAVTKMAVFKLVKAKPEVFSGLVQFSTDSGLRIEDQLHRLQPPAPFAKVAAVGPPGFGKSTLINAMASVLAESYTRLCETSSRGDASGHVSLAKSTINLLYLSCQNRLPTNAKGDPVFEYQIVDMVGHRGKEELELCLRGKVQDGEQFPLNDMDKKADIIRRTRTVADAVTTGIVLVDAEELIEKGDEPPQYITDIRTTATHYKPNTESTHPLPLMLVITKVDQWPDASGASPECLLSKTGRLAPLYAKAKMWGFDNNVTMAVGWLDSGDIAFEVATDPRVIVLKYLLWQSCKTSKAYMARLPRPQPQAQGGQ